MQIETIYNLVKRMEDNLNSGLPVKIGKYATHNHTEKIATIDAYLNSQHISGSTDSLGREKPFFNVITMAVNTWFKATEIDRKNIRFKPAKSSQRMKALLATILLRNWMIKHNFGQWLNKLGYKLACYGSVVSKFVEKDKELLSDIISWDRIICDPVDFAGNPKVEKLYFTPAQLRQQPYDADAIEEAIKAFSENKKETRQNIEGEDIDANSEYIGIYEVHGELPLFYLTGKEKDLTEYRQQMHVIFIEEGDEKKKKDKKEITLYSGKEEKDPYDISHLIEQEGRTLSIGAVEGLFDAQWMINHSAMQVKNQLDLASKILNQTADKNFFGRNITNEIETGEVLVHEDGKPLTQVNTQSHDIPQIMNYMSLWKQQIKEISGAYDSITGQTMPSGTPYSLGAMLNVQGMGMFEVMTENKGLCLENIIRKHVLSYFKKTLNNSEEIIALLEGEELETFDNLSLPARLESELRAGLMKGRIPTKSELMSLMGEQNALMGSMRPLKPSTKKEKTWKEYFSDFDMEAMEIEITGENTEKQVVYQTLFEIFKTLMTADPTKLQDPNIKKVFNMLIDEIGPGTLSPLQLAGVSPPAVMPERTTGGAMAEMRSLAPAKVEATAPRLVKARI